MTGTTNEARAETRLALAMPCKEEEAEGKILTVCAIEKRKDDKTDRTSSESIIQARLDYAELQVRKMKSNP